jgi:tripartite-type tricarboxylate transporter receptor subunit TctC
MANALVTTPAVPPERLAALRRAVVETMKDPDFLAAAATTQMNISPSSGEEVQKVADSIVDYPATVVARAKALVMDAPTK